MSSLMPETPRPQPWPGNAREAADLTPPSGSRPADRAFELGGRSWPLRKKVPYQLIRRAALGVAGGDVTEMMNSLETMLTFATRADHREAFRRFLAELPGDEDEDSVFDLDDLMGAFRQVTSQVSRAPFPQSSESSGSSNRRNSASTSAASSPSTPSTSGAQPFAPTSQ